MKYIQLKITLVVLMAFFVGFYSIVIASQKSNQSDSVLFFVKSDKTQIIPGEIVNLEFEFVNRGEKEVQVPTGGVMSGNIRIFVARKGQEFRRYLTAGWGRLPEKVKTLKANETLRVDNTNASLLWNAKPNYSHLNSDAAKEADEEDKRILDDFAFSQPGEYLIKAISCLIEDSKGCSVPIESSPVEITVTEPTGQNLEVWKILQNEPKVALFLQNGGASFKDKVVIERAEQIIVSYPDSLYSRSLRENLEKFNNWQEKNKTNPSKSNKP